MQSAAGATPPSFVLPDARGYGYARFELDAASRAWLLQNLPELADPLARASAWLALWDHVLEGDIGAAEILDGGQQPGPEHLHRGTKRTRSPGRSRMGSRAPGS